MKTILVVDDNKLNLATARTVLSDTYKVIPVMRGQQALTYLENGECDIILLDINMPEMDGFEVLEKIRAMEQCRNIPVIFLTADNDSETETRCFKVGAVDFIAKPFIPEVMLSRLSRALELEELRRSLADRLEQKTKEVSAIRKQAQRDALTGLWDRIYTEETVNEMLEQGVPGALMMIDVDNFKMVNDSHGHIVGDRMLKLLASTLKKFAEDGDVVCRIGGDEFAVFVKDVSTEPEMRLRAMDIIEEHRKKIEISGLGNTTISIGIALAPEDGEDFATLYNCADKALYYVKRNGKNAFHFFSDRLQAESERGKELVDLKYLQEFMRHPDNGKGAYTLDVKSFQYVYNFIRRFVDRSHMDVTTLLFTLNGENSIEAMEALEKTVTNSLRGSDAATMYSDKQMIAVLMNANNENSAKVAERIIAKFGEQYPDKLGHVHVEYSLGRILENNASKKPLEPNLRLIGLDDEDDE